MSGRARILDAVRSDPVVSVIVASRGGADTIARTLRSLAAQTMPAQLFEVIVVQNGQLDRTADVVATIRRVHPSLIIRRVEHRPAGLGRARNVGMSLARGSFVTFVDDDDKVSPTYLASLLHASAPDVVGVAHLADVAAPGAPADFTTRIAHQLVRAGERISPGEMNVALSCSVGKMLPTTLAREVGFDPDLRSSEDILFYISFFLKYPLDLRLCSIEDHAVYYRSLVADSMSRRMPTFDFNVRQQLDVIQRLHQLRPAQAWEATAIARLIRSETSFLNRYLRVHPSDHVRVLEEIAGRGVTVPHSALNRGLGTDLWVLGAPTSEVDLRESVGFSPQPGRVVDVVVAELHRRPTARKAIRESPWCYQVDDVVGVPVSQSDPHGWAAAERFLTQASSRLAEIYRSKPIHERVNTGTGFAAAHLLGAVQKTAHPELRWIAHVSDSARTEATEGPPEQLREVLTGMLSAKGEHPPGPGDLQTWARDLTFALADELVFASADTRDRVVATCEQNSLADRAREFSTVV